MQKQIIILFYFLFISTLSYAKNEVLLDETFSSTFGSFTLDEIKYPNCTYQSIWYIDKNYGYAKVSANKGGQSMGECDCKLISPILNTEDCDQITLSFEHTTYAGNNTSDIDYCKIKVSSDGINWHQINITTWPTKRWGFVSCEIDLTQFASNSLQFMFQYTSTNSYAGTWEVKNVKVEGFWEDKPKCPYEELEGLTSTEIRETLHSYISQHKILSYDDIRGDRAKVDIREDGMIWDIYSDYDFYLSDYCGYNEDPIEGDCYNREHILPKSWWGHSNDNLQEPMYTDLHHVISTDAMSNQKRSAWVYDEVENATWSNNLGSQLGSSTTWYNETAFEPIDEYKGDIARVYFYMLTCYMDKDFTVGGKGNRYFTYSNSICDFKPTALNLMLKWHRKDPVSEKEIIRNQKVAELQGNVNPFVEQPSLIEYIWGTMRNESYDCDGEILIPDSDHVDGAITCQEAREKALALSSGGQSTEEYIVVGYVTNLNGTYNTQYNSQTFWLADTPDGGNVFYAYQCYNDIAVAKGDKVSLTGNLLNYNGTPEIKWGQTNIIKPANKTSLDNITVSLNWDDTDVEIYSLMGQNMSAMREQLPKGIYILRKGNQTCKMIVQ